MISIGPYAFTETDAQRTIANFPQLWTLLGDHRDARVLDAILHQLAPNARDASDITDLHVAWAALQAAGPALRAAGQLPPTATGRVVALHRSDGGVPKSAVDFVDVGWRGVVGDRQATRVHHGRPWQALCLWSREVIETFAEAGHPIAAGLAGENITLEHLDWSDVRPGVRLALGSVLCEVSAYALPCSKNARWFVDGQFDVMHHREGPVSRVYATILEPGRIAVGDAAILEP